MLPTRFFLAGLALLIGVHSIEASDWRQWRGPQRSGAAPSSPPLLESLPEEGLAPLWTSDENVPGGGGGWSSPIVAEGRVFIYSHKQQRKEGVAIPPEEYPPLDDEKKAGMSQEEIDAYEKARSAESQHRRRTYFHFTDNLHCFDADSGKTAWTHTRTSGPTIWRQSGTPVFSGGQVCFLGADHTLVCLDGRSGEVKWTAPLPFEIAGDEPIVSSPLVVDGKVILCATRLMAFDAETGSVAWQGEPDESGGIYSSPAVWPSAAGDFVLANVAGGQTICVDPQTGRKLWRVEALATRSSPTVAGDLLITYGGSRKGGLRCYRMSPDGAELVWSYQRISDAGSSPVVCNDFVFAQSERKIACVDLKTGKAAWTETLDVIDPRYTSLVAADGKVFFAVEGVLCFRAEGKEMIPVFDACVASDGRLVDRQALRRRLGIEALERSAEGQQEAERLWQKEAINPGPLRCVTPALAEGRLYLRTGSRMICYDLRR